MSNWKKHKDFQAHPHKTDTDTGRALLANFLISVKRQYLTSEVQQMQCNFKLNLGGDNDGEADQFDAELGPLYNIFSFLDNPQQNARVGSDLTHPNICYHTQKLTFFIINLI